jgi:hypothetical protein
VIIIFTDEIIIKIKEEIKANNNYYDGCIEIKTNKNFSTLWLSGIAVFRFNTKKNEDLIEISNQYIGLLRLAGNTEIIKDIANWSTVAQDSKTNEQILMNISKIFNKCYTDSAVDIFGCCSRYLECSNKKLCVHPDKINARGCMYKANLDRGRIFYGKNRNID